MNHLCAMWLGLLAVALIVGPAAATNHRDVIFNGEPPSLTGFQDISLERKGSGEDKQPEVNPQGPRAKAIKGTGVTSNPLNTEGVDTTVTTGPPEDDPFQNLLNSKIPPCFFSPEEALARMPGTPPQNAPSPHLLSDKGGSDDVIISPLNPFNLTQEDVKVLKRRVEKIKEYLDHMPGQELCCRLTLV